MNHRQMRCTEDQHTAVPEYPPHFAQSVFRCWEVFEHLSAHNDIERVAWYLRHARDVGDNVGAPVSIADIERITSSPRCRSCLLNGEPPSPCLEKSSMYVLLEASAELLMQQEPTSRQGASSPRTV